MCVMSASDQDDIQEEGWSELYRFAWAQTHLLDVWCGQLPLQDSEWTTTKGRFSLSEATLFCCGFISLIRVVVPLHHPASKLQLDSCFIQ